MNLWPFSAGGREALKGETFSFNDWAIEIHPSKAQGRPEIVMISKPEGSKAELVDGAFSVDAVGVYEFALLWKGKVNQKRVLGFDPAVKNLPVLAQRYGSPKERWRKILRGIACDDRFTAQDINYSMSLMRELFPRSPATNLRGEIPCNPLQYCE